MAEVLSTTTNSTGSRNSIITPSPLKTTFIRGRSDSTTPNSNGQTDLKRSHTRSPRCEAFLMTGDKMLNLNPKISPCYAKACQNQLPPSVKAEAGEVVASSSSVPYTQRGCKNLEPSDEISPLQIYHDQLSLISKDSSCTSLHNSTKNEEIFSRKKLVDGHSSCLLDETDTQKNGIIPQNESLHDPSASSIGDRNNLRNDLHILEMNSNHSNNDKRFESSSQSTPVSPSRLLTNKAIYRDNSESSTLFVRNSSMIGDEYTSHKMQRLSRLGSAFSERSDILSYPEGITRLARHLFIHQEGIKIASFLVKSDDLSKQVTDEFLSLFNFSGTRIDAALRTFLSHVRLDGETCERERLLIYFAKRYFECNPTLFKNPDEVHFLSCGLLLLNTDIHGPNSGKKMSCREFIDNLTHDEFHYDRKLLKTIYDSIYNNPFRVSQKDLFAKTDRTTNKKNSNVDSTVKSIETFDFVPSSRAQHRARAGSLALCHPSQQIDYKHGWLLKKSLYDSEGKKTPRGRRKWQEFYATIRGMVLYLHKNEQSFSNNNRFEMFNNCILLHHSLAEIPKNYTRRKNVFLLRTAALAEYLFQASEQEELNNWVETINYVAAAFSTPALPTPVCSSEAVTFYKPLLPSSPTSFNIPEQLASHEQRHEETMTNLNKLREAAPSMNAKGKTVQEYFYKERYLDQERLRYSTYINTLREKLAKAAITQSSSASLKNLSAYNIDNTIRRHHGRISEELEIAETKEGNNI